MPEVMENPVASSISTNGKAKRAKAKKSTKAKKGNKAKLNGKPSNGKPRTDRGPSKLQVKVLKVLARNTSGLTRKAISDKVETFIGDSCLGHVDAKKLKPRSLLGRKLVSIHGGEPSKLKDGSFSETESASVFAITAAGKKAIE